MNERWIVISNCQSEGLANSIDALAKQIDCTACDAWEFRRTIEADPDHFRHYDFAVVMPGLSEFVGGLPFTLPPQFTVPSFDFRAYHPDCVYVLVDGEPFGGRMGHYHSMIALAAFKEGMQPERAATFFHRLVFEIANYFNLWSPTRNVLVQQFRDNGLDVAPIFVRGSRGGPIMHTVNHPTIEVLFDIARLLLGKLDRPTFAEPPMPPDGLAGLKWPIYPDLAEDLGVRGSYLYKPHGRHKPIELLPFLVESFESFGQVHKSRLRVNPHFERNLRRVRAHMRGEL